MTAKPRKSKYLLSFKVKNLGPVRQLGERGGHDLEFDPRTLMVEGKLTLLSPTPTQIKKC